MSGASEFLIEIHDLHYARGSMQIFTGLNLCIQRRQITAIMGPSGTGKTTLLRLITRQLIPDRGTILVDGIDIANLDQKDLYHLRRRFGMLFQNGALLTDLKTCTPIATKCPPIEVIQTIPK